VDGPHLTPRGRGALWASSLGTAQKLALLAILMLIVAGSALRAGAIGGDKRVSADEQGYGADANRLLADRPYASFKWAPGTPVLFALATRLSGHQSLRVVPHAHGPAQDMQLVLEIATLLLIAWVAWSLAGPWGAVIAVGLAALYIPLILITRTYLSEPFGGLMFIAALFAATRARTRGMWAVALAGVVAGVALLARNDLGVGLAVIGVALGLSARPHWRPALLRTGCFAVCALLVATPWLIYASGREGRFVPITTSGPNALFIGTYLPGHGEQYATMQAFKGEVCRRLPAQCKFYPGHGAAPMFQLIAARYPHKSEVQAVTQADYDNLDKYALGQPVAFAKMLWHKFWHVWSYPWSGGNGAKHPDTSRTQHVIFVGLAWLGLLGGALFTRRWALVTALFALLAVSALDTLFVGQPRDNVKLTPLLFTYGGAGLWLLVTGLIQRRRHRARAGAVAS
jgi:4-amino-4-deoxy-L-arabinose transferase-like glycosyltransferase